MQRLILGVTLLTSIGLSGCMTWAPHGEGGAAEDYPASMEPVKDAEDYPADLEPIELETLLDTQHELRQDLNHVQRYLDILVMQGANDCLPASVHELRLRETLAAG